MPLLRAYAAALPQVSAEESLGEIVDGRVASIPAGVDDARRHVRALESVLRPRRRSRPADARTLRAAGIAVVWVEEEG